MEHVTGMFNCRDPNLQQTLDRFAASAVWAASGEFTDRDIDEAKLSVFSQVDIIVPIVLHIKCCVTRQDLVINMMYSHPASPFSVSEQATGQSKPPHRPRPQSGPISHYL